MNRNRRLRFGGAAGAVSSIRNVPPLSIRCVRYSKMRGILVTVADSRYYESLAVDELRRRLEAAERVCAVFGWTAVRDQSDRDKALHELWVEWLGAAEDGFGSPLAHPELTDETIGRLARQRDEKRAAALQGLGL